MSFDSSANVAFGAEIPRERFQRLTRIASRLFDVPMVLLVEIGPHDGSIRSAHNIDEDRCAGDPVFWKQALSPETAAVPDMAANPLFARSGLVADPLHLRFYADGALGGGTPFRGKLILLDSKVRAFDETEFALFADFLAIAGTELGAAAGGGGRSSETGLQAPAGAAGMLAEISHQIRTPLGGIVGGLELLADTALTPEQRSYLDLISSGSDALAGVAGRIAAFSGAEPDPAEAAPAEGSPRVLVAESDPVNRMILLEQLSSLGCAVRLASNGWDVLEALKSPDLDVVMIDCQMPGMNVGRIAEELQKRNRSTAAGTRIVALTANGESPAAECLAVGVDACLTKPVRLEELKAAILSPPPASPVVGEEQLESLRTESPGLLEQLIALFTESTEQAIATMQRAAAAGNAREIGAAAHMLKGSALNFGAVRLVAACHALEQAAQRGEQACFEKLLDALRAEYQLVHEALNAC